MGAASRSEPLSHNGRAGSGVTQFDDPGGTGAAQVVIPSLHHDRAPVIKIGAHVAICNALRTMTETGFGHVPLDAHVAAPGTQ